MVVDFAVLLGQVVGILFSIFVGMGFLTFLRKKTDGRTSCIDKSCQCEKQSVGDAFGFFDFGRDRDRLKLAMGRDYLVVVPPFLLSG